MQSVEDRIAEIKLVRIPQVLKERLDQCSPRLSAKVRKHLEQSPYILPLVPHLESVNQDTFTHRTDGKKCCALDIWFTGTRAVLIHMLNEGESSWTVLELDGELEHDHNFQQCRVENCSCPLDSIRVSASFRRCSECGQLEHEYYRYRYLYKGLERKLSTCKERQIERLLK